MINMLMIFLYTLLFILLAFILLLTVFLTVPVRYRLQGSAGFGTPNQAQAEVSWFLRLFRVYFSYENHKTDLNIKVAWFDLSGRSSKSESGVIKTEAPPPAKSNPEKQPDKSKKTKPEKKANDEKEIDSKGTGFIQNLASLQALLTNPERKTIIALCFRLIKKLFNNLKPKKIDVEGIVGFEDPANTGMLIGAYEALAGMSGMRTTIRLHGDFGKSALSLNGFVSGRISAVSILIPLVWFCLHKPIFKIIKSYIKKNREDE